MLFSMTDHNYTKTVFPTKDFNYCKQFYVGDSIADRSICVGYMIGGVGPAKGDSGSPLVINVNDKLVLVGIVSRGVGAEPIPNYPALMTDTNYLLEDWLEPFIKRDSMRTTNTNNTIISKMSVEIPMPSTLQLTLYNIIKLNRKNAGKDIYDAYGTDILLFNMDVYYIEITVILILGTLKTSF